MARYGYKEVKRLQCDKICVVLGRDDRSTNPKSQYPAHLERVVDEWVLKLSIPTRFGWACDVPGLKDGDIWNLDACADWFEFNLHKATTTHRITRMGVKISAKGQVCPAVVERQKELAANAQKQREEALAKHQESVKKTQDAQRQKDADWYQRLLTATEFGGFNGWEKILSVEGDGPDALVTLKSKKGTRTIEAKWLSGGGSALLR